MLLRDLTVKKFHAGLVNKEFKALEIAEACFNYIEEKDKEIQAFLSLSKDTAFREAEAADLKIARGEKIGPLDGAPVAVKDNILIEGEFATAGSRILENYTAAYDASAVKKLREAGAVFLGKTNLDEFAMGSSTENSGFKITRNPHDLTRVPGGSSGGSAAAVASHMALAALGSDTGGSVREPASFCGVVGLKPTYGAVSRFGLIAMASSLDQIGSLARTAEDAGLIFNFIRGKDGYDSTSADAPYGEEEILNPKLEDIKKLRIGLPEEYFIPGMEPEVSAGMEEAIKAIKTLGVEFKKINLPHTRYALSCYYIIMPAEVSANLARFDGIRYARIKEADSSSLEELYFSQRSRGFGDEAKRRIILGNFVLSSGYYDAYYSKAQRVRRLIKNDFQAAFKEVDLILTPVAPTRAFKIGEKISDPLTMYLSDVFTIPASLAGLPAMSIPVRANHAGLPVGFQIIGRPFREPDLLGLGQFYERIHYASAV